MLIDAYSCMERTVHVTVLVCDIPPPPILTYCSYMIYLMPRPRFYEQILLYDAIQKDASYQQATTHDHSVIVSLACRTVWHL